ncbi:MAG: hypothetical protein WC490_07350 [Candidatus Margulisiibacteriota bacterium]
MSNINRTACRLAAGIVPELAVYAQFKGISQCRVYDLDFFLNNLGMSRKQFAFAVTRAAAADSPRTDERTAVISVKNTPLGEQFSSLRLKGVFPRLDETGGMETYLRGRGRAELHLGAVAPHTIGGWAETFDELSPYGSMRLDRLKIEMDTAAHLGTGMTDSLLGFGIYEQPLFRGDMAGFAVYGMTRDMDVRLGPYLEAKVSTCGITQDVMALAVHSGGLLRQMHTAGRKHTYPHHGNFAVESETAAKIVDLDSSEDIRALEPDHLAPQLYLDLARGIYDYMADYLAERHNPRSRFYAVPLLPHFLWGYFKGDTSLAFVRMIEPWLNGQKSDEEYRSMFGYLPGMFEPSVSFSNPSLMNPYYVVSVPRGLDTADLSRFPQPLFGSFYEALYSVAEDLSSSFCHE